MIKSGIICISTFPYYNKKTKRNAFKSRPVLVINQADFGDYNILPMSRVTNSNNLDPNYDVKVDPAIYPKLQLSDISYVRVHKQSVVNSASLAPVSDLKTNYPDLFLEITGLLEQYHSEIIDAMIS